MALIESGNKMSESTSIEKTILLTRPDRRNIIPVMKEYVSKHTLTDLRDLKFNFEQSLFFVLGLHLWSP